MEYTITDETKGCLHCGQFFEAKRASMVFCTDKCKVDYNNLKPVERYLNPPIVNRVPLAHGDVYTSHGEVMQLELGVLRVRKRFEDPAVAKGKKDEQVKADKSQENGQSHKSTERPKRRGQ